MLSVASAGLGLDTLQAAEPSISFHFLAVGWIQASNGESIQTNPRGYTLPFQCVASAPSGLCQTNTLCQAAISLSEASGEE